MKYDKLTKEDLSRFHKIMPLSKALMDYKQKIEELQTGEVGHFTLSKEDSIKTGTIKMRLLRAAKLIGVTLTVKRYGNDIVFYKEEAEVKKKKT